MSQRVLVMVYFSVSHLIMSYGIIFWGASPHSTNIFRLQKKLRIVTNTRILWMMMMTMTTAMTTAATTTITATAGATSTTTTTTTTTDVCNNV